MAEVISCLFWSEYLLILPVRSKKNPLLNDPLIRINSMRLNGNEGAIGYRDQLDMGVQI